MNRFQEENCVRWSWFAATGLACVLFWTVPAAPIIAQGPTPTATVTDVPLSTERDADFEADLEYLQRKANVLKQVIRRVRPAVVHIEAERPSRVARYGQRLLEEAGSGTIIALHGRYYVLTNRHVIRDAPLAGIELRLEDGSRLQPVALWSDQATDIAVIEVSDRPLVAAPLGDSDQVDIGDFVLAVGSPFGLSHSVTFGIISAKGRRDLELGDDALSLQDFLQTDAAINPGNSGGPLLNLRGEVIGINTAIASASGGSEGIGFAIPINMALAVAEQLLDKGRVDRAYLGVQLDSQFTTQQALALGLPRRMGARVTAVTPGSPAERAGIAVGDVIISFDGTRIEDDNHLVNRVGLTPIGKEVVVELWRNAERLELRVTVEPRMQYERQPTP